MDSDEFDLSPASRAGSSEAVIRGAFPKTPFFSALSERHMKLLIEQVRLIHMQQGEVLFKQGEPGDCLYVVASGEISVRVDKNQVARLGEGCFFGEVALLIDQPHAATTVAAVPSEILVIERPLFGALVAESPDVLRVLVRFVRDRLVSTVLQTSPLFAPFANDERRTLGSRFRFVEAQAGLQVIEQGRPSGGLFVMLAGRASVMRNGKSVATLGAGDVFGEISLLTRGPATATVTTQSKSFLLQLPRADFQEVIMTHPHVLEYVNDLAQERKPGADEHFLVM